MIKVATEQLANGLNLTTAQMNAVMEEIMTGTVGTPEIVSFLNNLNKKGETVDELTAAAKVMRAHAIKVHTMHKVILDTCGTGGDKKGTFNISTAAAFVVSGAGIAVAKHGNRSVSSKSGSADVLEALGVNINLSKEKSQQCLDDIGITFLFAQNFHPAMKYAMPARKEIGAKTIFNFLGPLSNPAGATHQLIGVYDSRWADILAGALAKLGTSHALVVRGQDGLDEITTTTQTFILEVRQGKLGEQYQIKPEDFGLKRSHPDDLLGGTSLENASILRQILEGKPGYMRDIVSLNAAAAIYTADKVKSIKEGMVLANECINSGKALEKLELLKKYS